MVAQACNPNTLEGQGGRITWAWEFETNLDNMMKPCLYKKLAEFDGIHLYSSCYFGGWGGRITWAWKVKAAINNDDTTALQPGQQSDTLFYKNQPTNKQNKHRNKPKQTSKHCFAHLVMWFLSVISKSNHSQWYCLNIVDKPGLYFLWPLSWTHHFFL